MIAMLRKRKNTFVDPEVFDFKVTKDNRIVITGIHVKAGYPSKVLTIPKGVYLDFSVVVTVDLSVSLDVLDFNNTPVVKGADHFAIIYLDNAGNLSSETQICNIPKGVKTYDFGKNTSKFVELHEGVEDVGTLYAFSEIKKAGDFPKSFRGFDSLFASSELEEPFSEVPYGAESIESVCRDCFKLSRTIPVLPSTLLNMSGAYLNCTKLTETGFIPDNVVNMNETFKGAIRLSKINNLPKSLISMRGSFADTSIGNCPKIPDGVQDISMCFAGCFKLLTMPVLPKGLRLMETAFSHCYELLTSTYIPDSVIDTTGTFLNCKSLQRVRNLPKSLLQMNGMFSGCTNFWQSPDLPPRVECAYGAFQRCVNMTVPPKLNNGLMDARNMFNGCERLLVFPILPGSLKRAAGMFHGVPFASGDLIIFSTTLKCVYKISDLIGDNRQNIDIYCYRDSSVYKKFQRCLNDMPNIKLHSLEEHPDYETLRKEYEPKGEIYNSEQPFLDEYKMKKRKK